MTQTEDEAKTKWCPHVRYTSIRGEGINRWAVDDDINLNPDLARCIGSDCMAWRRTDNYTEHETTMNLTDDWETMEKRVLSHPNEWAAWKKPEGEPPAPPGKGWRPIGPAEQAPNHLTGVLRRYWERPYAGRRGYCGLAGKP